VKYIDDRVVPDADDDDSDIEHSQALQQGVEDRPHLRLTKRKSIVTRLIQIVRVNKSLSRFHGVLIKDKTL